MFEVVFKIEMVRPVSNLRGQSHHRYSETLVDLVFWTNIFNQNFWELSRNWAKIASQMDWVSFSYIICCTGSDDCLAEVVGSCERPFSQIFPETFGAGQEESCASKHGRSLDPSRHLIVIAAQTLI